MKTVYNLYKVITFTVIAVLLILSVTGIWYGFVSDMLFSVAFGILGCLYIADNLYKRDNQLKVNKADYVYGAFFIFYALTQIIPVIFPQS